MGQAKSRGTFEQRRAEAIAAQVAAQAERDRREDEKLQAFVALPAKERRVIVTENHRRHMKHAMLAGLVAGLATPISTKRKEPPHDRH